MKAFITSSLIALAALAAGQAQAADDHMGHHMPAPAAAQSEKPMIDADVKKIDKSAGKITLSHGPLVNLNMPAMTMVFPVKDVASLDRLKAGDKVRFRAEQVNGTATVVHLEPAK